MKPIRTIFIGIIIITNLMLVSVHADEEIELVVVRSEHKLVVKKNGNTLRTFKVALGSGGRKSKLYEGDRKTPMGQYLISKIRDSDRFHLFIQLNYPNMNDAKRALKNHLIDRNVYRKILGAHLAKELPPQNTALGGAIGIHGIGHETKDKLDIHEVADWTQGCIAMRNHEVEELSRFIKIGTKINIIN